MDLGLIFEIVEVLVFLMFIITVIIAILKEYRIWGFVIAFLIGFMSFLLNKAEHLFNNHNNSYLQILIIIFSFIIISRVLDIFIKSDILFKDKEKKKIYIKEQAKIILYMIICGLFIIGLIYFIIYKNV